MLQFLLINLAVAVGAVVLLWLISLPLRDVSMVDIFWGCGFAIVAWVSLVTSGNWSRETVLIAVLVTVWGLRLAGYLGWRNWGKAEDHRYAEMREKHGKRFPLVSLFTVFLLQAVLLWVIALPIQVGILEGPSWRGAIAIGGLLWFTGMFFESVGDYQLARFKQQPENRGKVMNRGLWRYTRHPNYFGDFLVWWGLYLVALESSAWWWTVIGPLLMSFLLIRVSGVKLLERSLRNRVDGYDEYIRRTSAFVPMPPADSDPAR